MADISITAASVLKIDGSTEDGIAGATITAGQPVYLDTATNTYKLAGAGGTNDAAGILLASVQGIALHAALANQPLRIQNSETIAIGATVVLGGLYVLSTNVGMIAPYADLGSGHYVSVLGVATTTGRIRLKLNNSTIRHA